jgi:uncharacterized protein (TIGR00251 family)
MKIKVKVKTNSGEQVVEKISKDLFFEEGFEALYFVKLKSSAEGGKANLELVKLLSKYFGKEVKIKSGFSSRMKIVEVQ